MGCFYMIVIHKKKLIYVSLMVFATLIVCTIGVNRVENKKENTVETVALPVTNKVIVIDARASEFQMSGAQSSNRNNRGRNELKNSNKTAKFIRTIRCNSNINT